MGLPDNQLDALIKASLQQGKNVSPQHKQLAWERLSMQAGEQRILPATLLMSERSLFTRLVDAGSHLWRQFANFAVEEGRYERALRNRNMLRYNGMTTTGEISIHFLEPLRMTI